MGVGFRCDKYIFIIVFFEVFIMVILDGVICLFRRLLIVKFSVFIKEKKLVVVVWIWWWMIKLFWWKELIIVVYLYGLNCGFLVGSFWSLIIWLCK